MAEFQADTSEIEHLEKLRAKKKLTEEELKRLEAIKKQELAEQEQQIRKEEDQLIRETQQKKETATKGSEKQDDSEEKRRRQRLDADDDLEHKLALEREEFERRRQQAEGSQNVNYLTQELRSEEASLYTLTNYNVYNRLADIRNRLGAGENIDDEEQKFLDATKENAQRFITDHDYLSQKDPFDYVQRSEDVLKQIDAYMHLRK